MTPIQKLQDIQPEQKKSATEYHASTKAELGRLIHAAVINTRFRQSLLANPISTIEGGYLGEKFHFPGEVREKMRHIRAGNLEEFSSKMLQIVDTHSSAEMVVLHYR